MVILSFKALTKIKMKHMEEKDKKVGKFENLHINLILKLMKKGRNGIKKLIKKGGKSLTFVSKLHVPGWVGGGKSRFKIASSNQESC